MNLNGITAILFDIDGTLVDVDSAIIVSLERFHRRYGEELTLGFVEFSSRWRFLFEFYYTQFLEGHISFQEQKRCRIRDLFKDSRPDLKPESADRLFEYYDSVSRAGWSLYPDVTAALSALPGFTLGTLSNGDPIEQTEKLQSCGIDHFFQYSFTPADLGCCKPHRESFLAACRRIGHHPTTCLYVGDRLDIDARASANAGLKSIWLDRRGGSSETDDSFTTIRSLAEVPSLMW